jgi:4-hydroxybutyrate CoA-transferase
MSVKTPKTITAEQAAGLVKSGDQVIISHGAAEPQKFLIALVNRHEDLEHVEILHLRVVGPVLYLDPEMAKAFFHRAMMIGPNVRKPLAEGRADLIPIFYHMVPHFLRSGHIPVDVAVIQLAPPGVNGYCSYGICVSHNPASVRAAKIVIGEVNQQMPVVNSPHKIHLSQLDYIIDASYPLYSRVYDEPSAEEVQLAKYVASLIPNGATLQIGLGKMPDAVLTQLKGKNDLGVHTEIFGDGVMELTKMGVINNMRKNINRGKILATFAEGSLEFFGWLREAPVEMEVVDYSNDPFVIMQNDNVIAINGALEVDITGQINAESSGTRQIAGVGGQSDFALGAARSKGGKFIIAMLSASVKGDKRFSKIVTAMKAGSGISTSRALADYVVTEFGIAQLKGKTMAERCRALIEVAHPDFRDQLREEARQRQDIGSKM